MTADELLCPLAIVERDGARQLAQFEAETQEQAIALGKSDMAQSIRAGETLAFAREGVWRTAAFHITGPIIVAQLDATETARVLTDVE